MGKRIWGICIIVLGMMMVMPSMVGAAPSVIWDGEVELPSSTFDFVPTNNQSASYQINTRTTLGALQAASEEGNFEFNATDEYYQDMGTFSLNNISGLDNNYPDMYWITYVNGEWFNWGLGHENSTLVNGDKVTFWYAPLIEWGTQDIANATHVLNITVNAPDEVITTSPSRGSGGGTGHATILKVVDEEEQTVTPEEPQLDEDEGQIVPDADAGSAEQSDTSIAESEENKKGLPGFEGIVAIFGLLISAIFIMRRRL